MPRSSSTSSLSRPTTWAERRHRSGGGFGTSSIDASRRGGSSSSDGGISTSCGRFSCTFPFLFGLFALRLLSNVAYHYWTMPPKQATPKVLTKRDVVGDVGDANMSAEKSASTVDGGHRRITSSSAIAVDLGPGDDAGGGVRGGTAARHLRSQ